MRIEVPMQPLGDRTSAGRVAQPTESFSALDCAFTMLLQHRLRENEDVPDPLMITFEVVMCGILLEHMVK